MEPVVFVPAVLDIRRLARELGVRRQESLRHTIRELAKEVLSKTRSSEKPAEAVFVRSLGSEVGVTAPDIVRVPATGEEYVVKYRPSGITTSSVDFASLPPQAPTIQPLADLVNQVFVQALGGRTPPFRRIQYQPPEAGGRRYFYDTYGQKYLPDTQLTYLVDFLAPTGARRTAREYGPEVLQRGVEAVPYQILTGNADLWQALVHEPTRTVTPIDFGISWGPWIHRVNAHSVAWPARPPYQKAFEEFFREYTPADPYRLGYDVERRMIAEALDRGLQSLPATVDSTLPAEAAASVMQKLPPQIQRDLAAAMDYGERRFGVRGIRVSPSSFEDLEGELAEKLVQHYVNLLINSPKAIRSLEKYRQSLIGNSGMPRELLELRMRGVPLDPATRVLMKP